MVEALAIIMSALPVAGFFAIWIPFSAIATLIGGLHEIAVEPELLTRFFNDLFTDPELQPEVLFEGLIETLQHVLGM